MTNDITPSLVLVMRRLWRERRDHRCRLLLRQHIEFIRDGYPDGWSMRNEAHRSRR